MVEAACIEVAKTDTLQQAEVLARRVARRVFHLIQPLTETNFPGQEAIDEADALLMDLDRTDGSWMGDGARPPMEEFLARIAERLTEASLALGAAETDGNDPVAAARCLVREALPLAIALPVAFQTGRLTGDLSALIALQDGRQPARAPEPPAKPEAADGKEHHVLSAIALQASILLNLLDSAGCSSDLGEVHDLTEAARVVGACIGSLADGMTGEIARGNQYDWHQACEARSPLDA
ncbi:hypothetical protein N5C96_23455 [Delftia tsuruhatensis]|uniref:hypothetical protein n=1 Tax=Delftia tsuruhatensis TaxID=180282 RepID=UPI00244534CA|nr:hypothetical protein [Delftia tsuruhatensis]MDH0776371.1 hypothetical protein [Delftia tsuruhatensis]MDH1460074.1 hypothetical protein [Delftia tsuruhatensis]MDH1823037.1 hypothetical protein [Delftia tsuruhatensis]WGG12243.1 hypothetical protein N5O86_06265 [Delftia tsuruhatensis]